jgi:hypothetical protein
VAAPPIIVATVLIFVARIVTGFVAITISVTGSGTTARFGFEQFQAT